ncbi:MULTISPECIES: hypothetical protein [unclassified Streptomyces]|uniref:hypothetical protein n=1 Tax=unclassified Streptomyces TaxID=2593676 RepID=UPI00110F843F|nr:hypothetical protein [Streptomyces sp. DASNCL29]TMU98175.1 hypothetical protein FGK60_10195 [Streptomyces sp. DASNCL29]
MCPTFFGGDHTGYDWLIGSGRLLDTDRYCVVVSELFGNGYRGSPSNHPSGSRFPAISSRDNVVAQHQLVTEELGAVELVMKALGHGFGLVPAGALGVATAVEEAPSTAKARRQDRGSATIGPC